MQADAGPLAAAELSTESVAVVDFLDEATSLLSGAKQQQAELRQAIERAEQEVREQAVPGQRSAAALPSHSPAFVCQQVRCRSEPSAWPAPQAAVPACGMHTRRCST